MHAQHPILPYGLIVIGVIYVAKPDIFYRWLEKQKGAPEATAMPRQNRIFMRVLGTAFIIIGSVILFHSR